MEVDTGCTLSLIPLSVYNDMFTTVPLSPSNITFTSFTGEVVPCAGKFSAKVEYQGQLKTLLIHVVPGAKFVLLGRDWLEHLRMDWSRVVG